MSPSIEVLLAGWSGPLPGRPFATPREISLGAITAPFLRNLRRTVLVLGAEALRRLRPEFLRRNVRVTGCVVIGVPEGLAVEQLTPWARSGVVELVSPERLGVSIENAARAAHRPALPPGVWIRGQPVGLRTMRGLLEAIPSLRNLTVEEWARANGVCTRTLLRLCRHHLGRTPKDVLVAYRDAVVVRDRRGRIAMRAVVESVGMANEPNLRRSFRRRGLAFPARETGPARPGPARPGPALPRPQGRPLADLRRVIPA